MPDIVIETEAMTKAFKEVVQSIYNFGNDIVIEFCGLTFCLWDMFIAVLVVGLLAYACYGFSE